MVHHHWYHGEYQLCMGKIPTILLWKMLILDWPLSTRTIYRSKNILSFTKSLTSKVDGILSLHAFKGESEFDLSPKSVQIITYFSSLLRNSSVTFSSKHYLISIFRRREPQILSACLTPNIAIRSIQE